ncbi:hypothetical protein Ahy_Scaffold1g107206 [Arachis hypogaea]|uniref:Ubiquitin-like protease family profile domain-containing protein n=1 Tax=Arachis hypogaea TaxID=3818 RepID=A0A444WUU1_ARAHY|nr:hypothetical protein Ahy_Scaffold1g107206 [Arachis hypogaea]
MAHSSTSPSHSKKTQTVHFRATLQTTEIAIVAKIRTLHQHIIELSINKLQKKRSYNTQGVTVLVVLVLLQTKDLKCATHLLSEKFRNMSEEKKTIVRDLGFGGLMHIPPLRVHHQILRELANSFKLGKNRLKTGYVFFKKLNYKDLYEDDKEIFRRFQGKTLKNLIDEMMAIGVDKKRVERPQEPWIANWSKEQMESKKRKKNQEDSDSESESTDETQSKKKKVIVEDSSPEQAQSYHGEKEVDLRSTEGHYFSSEMLSLVEESASETAEENMMVVREETSSEALAIVLIQVCLPLSQTTTVPEIEEIPETKNEPTPLLQIEGTTKSTPEPPNNLKKAHPHFPQLHLKWRRNRGIDAGASQGERKAGEGIFGGEWTTSEEGNGEYRFGGNEASTQVKEEERLQAQDIYTLSKLHIASLALETHIEAENMALANHPHGVFLQPKNNKPFRVEDYPMFIPFLDLQKLTSHRFHWWLWFADTRKRKFYIVDQYHTKSLSDERTALNTFIGYVISRIKVYTGGTSEIKGQGQGNCTTIPSHLGTKDKHEVDHFRVEYASRILFHDMNLDKAEAIRRSNAIRLSKPFSLLLSPYCQIDSKDVDTY